jgi:hypothetical protein
MTLSILVEHCYAEYHVQTLYAECRGAQWTVQPFCILSM